MRTPAERSKRCGGCDRPVHFPSTRRQGTDTRTYRPCTRRPSCNATRIVKSHELQIEPSGPFRLDLTAWALRRNARNSVDRWSTSTYERVLSLAGRPVALAVTQVAGPDTPRLSVVLAGRQIDQPTEELVRSTLDRLLALSVDLSPFAAMAAPDPLLGPLGRPGGRRRSSRPAGPSRT
jgi:hypothetical protein